MHLQTALRSQLDKGRKNNSLFASPSIRCPTICQETERWGKEYLALPSRFIRSRDSLFYPGNEKLVEAECAYLANAQQDDGAFDVTWQWYNDYKEFDLAANW